MERSERVVNEILHGDTVYVSAIPVLIFAGISDMFDKIVNYLATRLIRRIDHRE